MSPVVGSARTPSLRQTETRHHPAGRTCHHFDVHRLTCDEYDELRTRAAGRCEMCGTPESETGGKRLVVDHFSDHTTPMRFVRGLLCDKCNTVMACFDENKPWGKANRRWEEKAREYEARSFQRPTAAQRLLLPEIREARRAHREGLRCVPVRTLPTRAATVHRASTVRIPVDRPVRAADLLQAAMTDEQVAALIAALQASRTEAA